MSYQKLQEVSAKISEVESWNTLLVKYNHKKAPNEFTCYEFSFAERSELLEIIEGMYNNFLSKVDSFDQKIVNYTGTNSSKVVDKLNINHQLICDCWTSLVEHISISDDSTSIDHIVANAYIFVGTYPEKEKEKNIYFITRKNPIINCRHGKKFKKVFVMKSNSVEKSKEPVVQFDYCFDAVVYEGVLYTINDNWECIFNIERSRKKICKEHLEAIKQADIISDFNEYSNYALSRQTPCKFLTFDNNLLNKISTENGFKILQETFKIPINNENGKIDLSDPTNAKNFTSIVCAKTKKTYLKTSIVKFIHLSQ